MRESTASNLRSAVIFDFDGTLTKPYLDFDAIRAEIGIAAGPILEAIAEMGESGQRRAEAILDRHEWDAARHAVLQDGAARVVAACRAGGHPVGILTRNARRTLQHVLDAHGIVVDAVRTREDGPIKPSPAPVLALCAELGAEATQSWIVGDHLFDIIAGREAGARTVLLVGATDVPDYANRAHYIIRDLPSLLELIR